MPRPRPPYWRDSDLGVQPLRPGDLVRIRQDERERIRPVERYLFARLHLGDLCVAVALQPAHREAPSALDPPVATKSGRRIGVELLTAIHALGRLRLDL